MWQLYECFPSKLGSQHCLAKLMAVLRHLHFSLCNVRRANCCRGLVRSGLQQVNRVNRVKQFSKMLNRLSLFLVLYANNKLPWIGPHQIKLLQLRRIQYPCWFVWKTASKKNVVNPWAMDPVVTDCKSEGLQCSLFHYICLLHWQISHEMS